MITFGFYSIAGGRAEGAGHLLQAVANLLNTLMKRTFLGSFRVLLDPGWPDPVCSDGQRLIHQPDGGR